MILSNLALTTLPGNENVFTSRERTDDKTVDSGALSKDMRGNCARQERFPERFGKFGKFGKCR